MRARAAIMGLVFVFVVGIFDDVKASHIPGGWGVLLESEVPTKSGLSEVSSRCVNVLNGTDQVQYPVTLQNILNLVRIQNAVANGTGQRDAASYIDDSCKSSYSNAAWWHFIVWRSLRQSFFLWQNDGLIINHTDIRGSASDIDKIKSNFERSTDSPIGWVNEPSMFQPHLRAMSGTKFRASQFDLLLSSLGASFGQFRSFFGFDKTAADEQQLPYEQCGLQDRSAKQPNRERCQPVRIISDPLRFESELCVSYCFLGVELRSLGAVALLLLGLLFGIWGGQNFYRERFLIGVALIGCGWLCGWCVLGTRPSLVSVAKCVDSSEYGSVMPMNWA